MGTDGCNVRLALDTNLLSYPASRRFLHGVALDTDSTIIVLPEVEVEATRVIAAVVRDSWEEALEDDARYSLEDKQSFAEAAAGEALSWFSDLLGKANAFVRPPSDAGAEVQARRIARSLPPDALEAASHRPWPLIGDPLIVGQALVYDVDLLSTNNFKTIAHEIINEWAMRRGRNKPLLYLPDDLVRTLFPRDMDHTYEWTLGFGPWEVAPDDALGSRRAYELALNHLSGAGFKSTASRAAWRYERDERFMDRARAASRSPAARAAWSSEADLRERVSRRVSAAGYAPEELAT